MAGDLPAVVIPLVCRADTNPAASRGSDHYDLTTGSQLNDKDAKETARCNKYIHTCAKAGILREKEGENLRADDAITRAEPADIISRIWPKNDKQADFTDIKSHRAEDAINQGYGKSSRYSADIY
ncbi:MAG: S-layer homology domain-containing protein [Clostridiales bacterium]|nr:S-layer homology domain-containing protein [Clostridiales bacterium]